MITAMAPLPVICHVICDLLDSLLVVVRSKTIYLVIILYVASVGLGYFLFIFAFMHVGF